MWAHRLRSGTLAALLILLMPLAVAAQGSDVEGTIEIVDQRGELVVRTSTATRRVRFDAMTLIVVGGQPASVSDLRPGQRVRIQLHVTMGGAVRDLAARIAVVR